MQHAHDIIAAARDLDAEVTGILTSGESRGMSDLIRLPTRQRRVRLTLHVNPGFGCWATVKDRFGRIIAESEVRPCGLGWMVREEAVRRALQRDRQEGVSG